MASIRVAQPHGFCAGVARALRIADEALRANAAVWCLHAIVHNTHVVDQLTARGMRFVETLGEVPDGAVVLFSAHGVPPAIRLEAARKHLQVIDATCPFVDKVHREVAAFAQNGSTVLCIGNPAHAEVVGVAGEAPGAFHAIATEKEALSVPVANPERVAVVTQTTISAQLADRLLAILRRRFPHLQEPRQADICTATRERQQAVARLAAETDLVIVLGSPASSNSRRLAECARAKGTPAVLVDSLDQLDQMPLPERIGLTSGASTPEDFLLAAKARLEAIGGQVQ